jgi:HAD superfamily phosphatase (TIGR01668 family)
VRNFLRPTYLVEAVWDIDLEALHRRGIRGLIIDLDNTIVDWNGTRLRPAVREWIEAARRRGFRMCVTSNALRRGRAAAVAEQLGLRAVLRAGKPLPRAFRRSMGALGTAPTSTCAVGDQVFTDMVGANWLGLTTVLVRPLSRRESPHTRAIRLLERPLRRRWAAVASGRGGGEVGG